MLRRRAFAVALSASGGLLQPFRGAASDAPPEKGSDNKKQSSNVRPDPAANNAKLRDFARRLSSRDFGSEGKSVGGMHAGLNVQYMTNDVDEVARAYSLWAAACDQAPVADFLAGAVQAYSALGQFIDSSLRRGVPYSPRGTPAQMAYYWNNFLKEQQGPLTAANASTASVADAAAPPAVAHAAGTFFSQRFALTTAVVFHDFAKDKLASLQLHPTHPLRMAGKDDVVVEAELSRFVFTTEQPPEFLEALEEALETKVRDGGASPGRESSAADVKAKRPPFEAVDEVLAQLKEAGAQQQTEAGTPATEGAQTAPLKKEKKTMPPHLVFVDVTMTVMVPPRRFLDNFSFFYDRITECDERTKRMSLAKAMVLGGAYPIVKALDVFMNLVTGSNTEIMFMPAFFNVIFPGVANPIPVVRKIVSFTLHPNGNWVLDNVTPAFGPEEMRCDRPEVRL